MIVNDASNINVIDDASLALASVIKVTLQIVASLTIVIDDAS